MTRFAYVFLKKKNNNRILIISLNYIGDVLFCTPAIRQIKQKWPEKKIDAWVKKECVPILQFDPDVHEIFSDTGAHTDINSFTKLIKRISINRTNLARFMKNDYDIIFDMSACFESALLTTILGRKKKYGIYATHLFKTAYDRAVFTRHKPQHLKYFYCEVAQLAGTLFDKSNSRLILNIPDNIKTQIAFTYPKEINNKMVTIAPFTGWRNKEWDIEHFLRLAEKLVEINCKVFFIGAPFEQRYLEPYSQKFNSNIQNLLGKTSLLESAALIGKSDLFIGCDSSPAHIADALNTKSIVLFGTTNPNFHTIPGECNKHVIYKKLNCSADENEIYCVNNYRTFKCPKNLECMNSITVEEVIETAKKLLK